MGFSKHMHLQLQEELMQIVNEAERGDITMLDAFIQLEEERKQLEMSMAIVKSFKDANLEYISQEAKEYPEGYRGYSVEVRNGGKIYSYKNIPEWQEYNKAVKECEKRYKSALDAKINGNPHANVTEDGEELPLPEITYRKSSIILKKK